MKIEPGIYLQKNAPRIKQFRKGRRKKIKPVIVLHTAESVSDTVGEDTKAEAVARFVRTRTTYGSYHLIGDRDSIIQLVSFSDEAFHDGTGSNSWSIGISLAMKSADWTKKSFPVDQYLNSMVQMAGVASDWLERNGYGEVKAKRLTKAQSNLADANGFISHGDRDPSRRSDPGVAFPWANFLDMYSKGREISFVETSFKKNIQKAIGVTADGIIGPKSMSALSSHVIGDRSRFEEKVGDFIVNDKKLVAVIQKELGLKADGIVGTDTDWAILQRFNKRGLLTTQGILEMIKDSE